MKPEMFADGDPFAEAMGWPNPKPFPLALSPVPPLEAAMLPAELRDWASDIAERLSVPLDFVGVPAMVAAGAVIGRRVAIAPDGQTDWCEAANLWGLVVGAPGMLKSPAVAQALAPLKRLEARAAEEFVRAEGVHALSRDVAELARAAAKSKALKACKTGDLDGAREALAAQGLDDDAPIWRRHVTNDGTAEKLGELLANNPAGLLVHRDEALSLFRHLDREENAAARGFYMTGWSGSEGYTFDRIGRGTVHVPAVTLSFLGTTQPGVFAAYQAESLRQRADGMVQRMQMLSWPDATGWRECDRPPHAVARDRAFGCFDRLSALDGVAAGAIPDPFNPDGMPTLRFAPDALARFKEWRGGLEAKVREPDRDLAFVAHLSKYRGLIPRLALVCHLAGGAIGPVSDFATMQALAWAEYLEAHALRAYGAGRLDAVEAARAIWRRIGKGELRDGFTAREVKRKGWSGLDGKRAENGLAELVELDRLREDSLDTGGRPTVLYRINPKGRA